MEDLQFRSVTLHLLRHAASTREKLGRFGRRFDASLDPLRVRELDDAKGMIEDLRLDSLISSPLERCKQSLRYVCDSDCKFTIDPAFTAYHSGYFEDKTDKFVREFHPEYLQLSYGERFLKPIHGEESIAYQRARVAAGLFRILAGRKVDILISTHYSVINMLGNLIRLEFDLQPYAEGRFDVPLGGYLRLAVDVESLGDFLPLIK